MGLLSTPGAILDAGSGLLLVALAAFVLSLRPRRRVNVALAVFSGGQGLYYLVANLVVPDTPADAALDATLALYATPALLAAVVALVLLALSFPRSLAPAERRLLLIPGALTVLMAATQAGFLLGPWRASDAVISMSPVAQWFALALLAVRFRACAPGDPTSRQILLFSAGLLLNAALVAGLYGRTVSPFDWAKLGAALLVAALWIANAAALPAPAGRGPRNVALLTLVLVVLGMTLNALFRGTPGDEGPYGLSRIAMVALLAYAILRHQLLGIDVRLKWTIRQSTIAAAFLGVFFVVSESASTFFAGEGGLGPYLGIAAAGVLVFALAPLQRAAERVADAAMPHTKAAGEMTRDERARLYVDQVRGAWADGSLSRDEREMLERLRVGLGLSPEEAHRLEREAAFGMAP